MLKQSVILMILMTGVAVAEESASYLNKTRQVGEHVWIGPQPEAADFNEFAAEEVTLVLNTRTQGEMTSLGYDEAAKSGAFNIDYELLEIGDGHPYSPAKLTAFNDIMQAHQGQKMVLHCRSGHRANQLYAAWLIKYQNTSPTEAFKAIQSEDQELTDAMKSLLGQ